MPTSSTPSATGLQVRCSPTMVLWGSVCDEAFVSLATDVPNLLAGIDSLDGEQVRRWLRQAAADWLPADCFPSVPVNVDKPVWTHGSGRLALRHIDRVGLRVQREDRLFEWLVAGEVGSVVRRLQILSSLPHALAAGDTTVDARAHGMRLDRGQSSTRRQTRPRLGQLRPGQHGRVLQTQLRRQRDGRIWASVDARVLPVTAVDDVLVTGVSPAVVAAEIDTARRQDLRIADPTGDVVHVLVA